MPRVTAYTKAGSKSPTPVTLPDGIFAVKTENHELLGQAYRMYLANNRIVSAKTLKRGEVRGGGRKPWRQKGTGRARFGSIRVPIWRGGGITFGPTGNENYSIKLPLKAKRLAVRQALSLKVADDAVVVVEDFAPAEGKTKSAVSLLSKLGVERKILIVVDKKQLEAERSVRNIEGAEMVSAHYLSVFKLLNADKIVITKAAIETITNWLEVKSAGTPDKTKVAKASKAGTK